MSLVVNRLMSLSHPVNSGAKGSHSSKISPLNEGRRVKPEQEHLPSRESHLGRNSSKRKSRREGREHLNII